MPTLEEIIEALEDFGNLGSSPIPLEPGNRDLLEEIIAGLDENDFIIEDIINNPPQVTVPGAPGSGGSNLVDNVEPTFEEIFQEQLAELLGPDPGATFRNVFNDIISGFVNTPLEEFILSQFDELQAAFITAARGAAERGESIPTFEQFLQFVRPDVERRFEFTEPGALDAFQQLLQIGGGVDTPFVQFVTGRFDRLFDEFIRSQGAAEERGEEPADFLNFITSIQPRLEEEFQFTRPGARESFRERRTENIEGGLAVTPFERFLEQNFDRLFDEFQLTGTDIANRPEDFSEFLGSIQPRLEEEFAFLSPFERGERRRSDLAPIPRIQ